ncbi:MAG TPA: spermidine/putrescine ABC transporter permease [Ruminiclostridium sp.]|nr:ABC transporter permease [Clostridiaceae bacterium]HAA25716.1 spermidine/putrescine ABC transporter permease [Ruminiclostridium sp.]
MVGKTIKRIYIGIIFLFLYAPILVLIVYSFNESKSRGHWGGFTLKWYGELFRDPDIIKALYYTFIVALLSSLISTIIGTFAAIGIHNMGLIGKKVVLNINYLPVLNPDIVTGVALMTLFISVNMRLGFLTMLISHVMFNIPYVILSVLPKLRQMNRHMAEAALDLGATPFYAMRKVVIPEIMPGVVTGALMAFTLSVDDFVISFFNTGSGVTNLSIVIYSMARRGIKPSINALSTIMLLTVAVLLLVINKRTAKGDELIP